MKYTKVLLVCLCALFLFTFIICTPAANLFLLNYISLIPDFFGFFDEIFSIPGSGNSGGRSGVFSGKSSSSPKGSLGTPKTAGKAPVGTNGASTKISKASGSILSAWGIISLVLFIIVGSALAYYISIFYPLICAKRGKYDVMEMTTV